MWSRFLNNIIGVQVFNSSLSFLFFPVINSKELRDVVEYVAVEFILFFAVIKSLMLRDVVHHNGVNFSPSFL